jgi:hypothetical protein
MCGHNGADVAWEIDVERGVHLLMRETRGRVDHERCSDRPVIRHCGHALSTLSDRSELTIPSVECRRRPAANHVRIEA